MMHAQLQPQQIDRALQQCNCMKKKTTKLIREHTFTILKTWMVNRNLLRKASDVENIVIFQA